MLCDTLAAIMRLQNPRTEPLLRLLETTLGDPSFMLKDLAINVGAVINLTDLGRRVRTSYHTMQSHIQTLESKGIIRLLQPLPAVHCANQPYRRPKSPKLYFRSTALLLALLDINDGADLPDSILGDRIYAGFMLERIIAEERRIHPDSSFYYYGGYYSRPVDLIIVRAEAAIGLVFKLKWSLRGADWSPLKAARKKNLISRGFALHAGLRGYSGARDILTVNGLYLLEDYDFLTDLAQKRCPLLMRVARNNKRYPAHVLRAAEHPGHANSLLT